MGAWPICIRETQFKKAGTDLFIPDLSVLAFPVSGEELEKEQPIPLWMCFSSVLSLQPRWVNLARWLVMECC